jgi:hypothetical protein
MSTFPVLGLLQGAMTPADFARDRGHTNLAAWLDRAASAKPSKWEAAGGSGLKATLSPQTEEAPTAQPQRTRRPRRRPEAEPPSTHHPTRGRER